MMNDKTAADEVNSLGRRIVRKRIRKWKKKKGTIPTNLMRDNEEQKLDINRRKKVVGIKNS